MNDGQWDDRAGFLARIAMLRRDTDHVSITVLDEVFDGDRYAERHIIELFHSDGRQVTVEVYLFATLDPDGRFARIEEVTLEIPAGELGPSEHRR